MKCYRIIKDNFAGFEVQVKKRFLFWSWWKQCRHFYSVNTFKTLEAAKNWVDRGTPIEIPPEEKISTNVVWITEGCK